MVIVKIWGGLGNQLFQYCFGRYLASKMGTEVKYDIQITNRLNSFTQRDLAVSCFNIHLQVASEAEINAFKYFRSIQLARLERKIAQQFPSLLRRHIVEPNQPRPFGAVPLRDDCYYEGYWQSYRYLEGIEELVRQELTLKNDVASPARAMLEQIQAGTSVSIHVRRGDYLHNKYFYTCSPAYYQKAMAMFAGSGTRFFIFTDDESWCRQHFPNEDCTIVTGNEHFEDLYLMSQCRHHIIANSTFSWWAAWLTDRTEKRVVAPQNWNRRYTEEKIELLPPKWIKI